MTEAIKDNNRINTMLGLLDSDGSTPQPVYATPSTNILDNDDSSSGSDLSGDDALRDNNRVVTLLAVSSSDGITPVPLYVNSSGELLIKST